MSIGAGPFHLIGIGGVGMSAIAQLLRHRGYRVSGSDIRSSAVTDGLESMGIRVALGHTGSNLGEAKCVIFSSSIQAGNPELDEARRRGITVRHRSEALASLSDDRFVVAVCGTHGKSTTTTLLGRLFDKAGRNPTVVVGAKVPAWNGNLLRGAGEMMILEADESDASFLHYSPDVILMTNIDHDHLDYFRTPQNIHQTFEKFLRRQKPDGFWCGCLASPGVRQLLEHSPSRAVSYGWGPDADYFAKEMRPRASGGSRFVLAGPRGDVGELSLGLIGRHNVLNTVGAAAVALECGVPFEDLRGSLSDFRGASRRFEVLWHSGDLIVVDDYGHHPTEIRATLEAARSFSTLRLVVFFEPHRFSRTRLLHDEFLGAFDAADEVVVTDIYAAHEKPVPGVTGESLARAMRDVSKAKVRFVAESKLEESLEQAARAGGMIVTLGAGSIGDRVHQVVARLGGPR